MYTARHGVATKARSGRREPVLNLDISSAQAIELENAAREENRLDLLKKYIPVILWYFETP